MKKNSEIGKNILITTFGMDGAASAALGLLAIKDAALQITSANRLSEDLSRINDKINIYICGVGAGDNFPKVINELERLKKLKCNIFWFCGRKYMDVYQEKLDKYCTPVLQYHQSNAAVIADYFKIEDDRVDLLLDLAEAFIEQKHKLSDVLSFWLDFSRASAARYFKYDDTNAFPEFIKKLAGISEISPLDEREVFLWRQSGARAQPLGNSKALKEMRQMISRIGPIDAPVLVSGESGSGKELAARLLHESSERSRGEFIAVNCAVLSTSGDLAHDRLFGHVAGAYTGADKDSPGAFEAAEGGTLFLDEVAELPLEVQTQLLRALEEKEIMPLGTVKTRTVNVRIVAATNRPLTEMVQEGTFRLDLYHRLNVLRVRVPSLSERLEDMPSIARSVLRQLKDDGYPLKISTKDWKAANSYNWPGNIRQFINLLRRAAYLKITLAEAINQEIKEEGNLNSGQAKGSFAFPNEKSEILPEEQLRKKYLQHVFELHDKNYINAASSLKMSVNTLKRWLGR